MDLSACNETTSLSYRCIKDIDKILSLYTEEITNSGYNQTKSILKKIEDTVTNFNSK